MRFEGATLTIAILALVSQHTGPITGWAFISYLSSTERGKRTVRRGLMALPYIFLIAGSALDVRSIAHDLNGSGPLSRAVVFSISLHVSLLVLYLVMLVVQVSDHLHQSLLRKLVNLLERLVEDNEKLTLNLRELADYQDKSSDTFTEALTKVTDNQANLVKVVQGFYPEEVSPARSPRRSNKKKDSSES